MWSCLPLAAYWLAENEPTKTLRISVHRYPTAFVSDVRWLELPCSLRLLQIREKAELDLASARLDLAQRRGSSAAARARIKRMNSQLDEISETEKENRNLRNMASSALEKVKATRKTIRRVARWRRWSEASV